MLSFHALRVTAVDRVAEDAACVTVEIPAALRQQFAFHAGQYVTVRRRIGELEERRTYSIVTAPGAATLKLGIRAHAGGRMSRELAGNLGPGDLLEVGTPMGRFRTLVDPARSHSYVAFAAGSGITPILSVATDVLGREPQSCFTLVYGNRTVSRTMFLEETLALKNRYLDRFAVYFVMSREPQDSPLLNGRIDAAKVRELAERIPAIATADEYLVCGPGDMVDAVRTTLAALNATAPVRFERFAAGNTRPESLQTIARSVATLPERLATISIVMDGRRRTFDMAAADATVLEAAERAGLELPYSCRAGICATCRTRITAGAAEMAHNIALEPWEVQAGFVLCCQARPVTSTLELNYDQK